MKNLKYSIAAGCVAVVALAFYSCNSKKQDAAAGQMASENVADTTVVNLKDYGKEPTVLNIEAYTEGNNNYRTVLWTGNNLQLTLMSIPVGEDIGLELHPNIDQFLRIEEGEGRVMMGDAKDTLNFTQMVKADYAVCVPAGKWHNIVNTGDKPLKLYSIYAPAEHPHGAIHKTKADAMEAEGEH